MSKILVGLAVPAIDEKYDILFPGFLVIGEITSLLANAVIDLTQRIYVCLGRRCCCIVAWIVIF